MTIDPEGPASHAARRLAIDAPLVVRTILAVGLVAGLLVVSSAAPPPAGAEAPKWTLTSPLADPREGHTTTVLAGAPCEAASPPSHCGKVLVAGGAAPLTTGSLASAFLYDPVNEGWEPTGTLEEGRQYHVALVLPNGHVLVIGGYSEIPKVGAAPQLASAETYDPVTGAWTATLPMINPRMGHTATLLSGPNCFPRCGQVLVTGGFQAPSSAELYDPVTRAWTPTATLTVPRVVHTATLLTNSKVLVAGTQLNPPGTCQFDPPETRETSCPAFSAELFDPLTATFTPTGPMKIPRTKHAAIRLPPPDDRILIVGGDGPAGTYKVKHTAEIYDPSSGTWTITGSMATEHSTNPLVPLPDGRILAVGAGRYQVPEVYNPGAGSWSTTDLLNVPRLSPAVLLDCRARAGRVFVVGGFTGTSATTVAELYNRVPTISSISPTSGLRGARVRIRGLALSLGAVGVRFGDVPAIDVAVNAAGTEVLATAPASVSGGAAAVTVTVGGVLADDCGRPPRFTFVEPPQVDRIIPDRGPATGGTTVKLVGKGLAGATAVHFGTAEVPPAEFQVNAAGTEITATSPAHDPGAVDITVTAGRVASSPSPATKFTYLPVLRALEPSRGEIAGGTTVAINGKGFSSATAVRFGGDEAAFTITSDTAITTTSPRHAIPEAVPVTITTASGLEAIPEVAGREMFTYFEPSLPPDEGAGGNQEGPSSNDGAPVKPVPPGGSPGSALSPAPGGAPGPAPGPAPGSAPGTAPGVQPGLAPGSAPAPGTAPGAQSSPVGSSTPASGLSPGSAPVPGASPGSASATANAPVQGAATPLPGSAVANPTAAPAVGDSSAQKGSERHAMVRRRDDDRAAATMLACTAAIALGGTLACFAELASRRRRPRAAPAGSRRRGAY